MSARFFFILSLLSCACDSGASLPLISLRSAREAHGGSVRRPAGWGQRPRAGLPLVPIIWDFSQGVIPDGIIVNSSGDAVWPQTSEDALAASPVTPGNGVGIFEDRGNGLGLSVFPTTENLVRTDPTVPGVDSCFNLVGGWGHSGGGNLARYSAQGLGPDGVTNICTVEDISAAAQGYIYTLGAAFIGHAIGSVWVRDCDGTEPTPLSAPSSPGVLVGVGSTGLEVASLGSGTTWRRINILISGGPDLLLKPAGGNGVVAPTGAIRAGFVSACRGVHVPPFIDNLSSASATAVLADVHLQTPSEAVLPNGTLHLGGILQQKSLRSYDVIPSESATLGNYVYLFKVATADGAFAMRARYDDSQFEWTLVARDTNIITSRRQSGEAGMAIGGGYLAQTQWEAKIDPGGEAYIRIGSRGCFTEKAGTDAGAAIPTPSSAYFHASAAGTEVLPGIVSKIQTVTTENWTAPAIILVGDSILSSGSAGSFIDRVGVRMLSDAQVLAGLNNIQSLATSGNKFADGANNQLDKINAMRSALTSGVRAVVISMGWNDFALGDSNATIRANCQALIDGAIAKFPSADIFLYSTTPAKGAVSGAAYAKWQANVADVAAGNVFTGVSFQSTELSLSSTFNDGADNLQPPMDSGDGQHGNNDCHTAIGAVFMVDLTAEGIIQ